jgi:hypothetical protein
VNQANVRWRGGNWKIRGLCRGHRIFSIVSPPSASSVTRTTSDGCRFPRLGSVQRDDLVPGSRGLAQAAGSVRRRAAGPSTFSPGALGVLAVPPYSALQRACPVAPADPSPFTPQPFTLQPWRPWRLGGSSVLRTPYWSFGLHPSPFDGSPRGSHGTRVRFVYIAYGRKFNLADPAQEDARAARRGCGDDSAGQDEEVP